ncbi:hypothetical protein [Nocardia sp. NPDC006630]|uniref:hypothetical protein n=1 Tax=Nocardia sp. NPDC006630 TaxID=3157181 RepID=UPI00339E537D
MGIMQDSPEFTAAINRYLTPDGKQKIAQATNDCTPQNILSNIGFDVNQYLTEPLSSLISNIDTLVSTYCAAGTPVTYRREQIAMPGSGHTGEWFLGAPGALAWLQQQAEDPAAHPNCDTQTVPATVLDPAAMNALTAGILTGPARTFLGL